MATIIPYTYFQCPCANAPSEEDDDDSTVAAASAIPAPTTPPPQPPRPASGLPVTADNGPPTPSAGQDRATFDPRAPRANYSLYPLEYLLYCDDCHQIRCPRCVNEEIVNYFCPNCLFEVPVTNLRIEGNRCTRSCFQCPICIAPLSVTNLDPPPDPSLLAADNSVAQTPGQYILSCSYCFWSSSEIGIRFDKPNGICSQLARLRNGGTPRLSPRELRERRREISSASIAAVAAGADPAPPPPGEPPPPPADAPADAPADSDLDPDLHFQALKTFYASQVAESSPQAAPGALSSLSELGISSPSSVQRLMSLYTGRSYGAAGGAKKYQRHPGSMREAESLDEGLKCVGLDESAAIAKLMRSGWAGTATREQQGEQQVGLHPFRFADELRPIPCLLRTKRSKRCPACRHIITKPEAKVSNARFRIRLVAANYIPSISIRPLPPPPPTPGVHAPPPPPPSPSLQPLRPVQYVLKFRNPIFENVRVTLATPAATPGRFASRVTLLCPQFEIDANTDMWDDALKEDPRGGGGRDRAAGRPEDGSRHQIEAGKIWERGRNWVSTLLEVVPAAIKPAGEALPLREDEDVLEIPMFVRLDWEAEPQADVGASHGKGAAKEKRELAYWCVLGIGRIPRE